MAFNIETKPYQVIRKYFFVPNCQIHEKHGVDEEQSYVKFLVGKRRGGITSANQFYLLVFRGFDRKIRWYNFSSR